MIPFSAHSKTRFVKTKNILASFEFKKIKQQGLNSLHSPPDRGVKDCYPYPPPYSPDRGQWAQVINFLIPSENFLIPSENFFSFQENKGISTLFDNSNKRTGNTLPLRGGREGLELKLLPKNPPCTSLTPGRSIKD